MPKKSSFVKRSSTEGFETRLRAWLKPENYCQLMFWIREMRAMEQFDPLEQEQEELIAWAEKHYARDLAVYDTHPIGPGSQEYHGRRGVPNEPCILNAK